MTPPKVRATFLGMEKRDTYDSIPKNCDCVFYFCLYSPYVWTNWSALVWFVYTYGLLHCHFQYFVFFRRKIVKKFSGIVIYPFFYVFYVLICKFTDVRTFWNPPAYQLVGVLV